MDDKKKSLKELHDEHHSQYWPMQNWRSWGSWFSWGSPVGLGIFFVLLSFAVWIWFHL